MRKDYRLEKRKFVICGFVIIVAIIYLFRLYELQINNDMYREYADANALLKKTIYPSRGLIYDRNGELIVYNQPTYDVMIVPRDVEEFDTLSFCNAINITKDDLCKKLSDLKNRELNPNYSPYSPQRLISHLSVEEYGKLQEKLYRFPGFYIQKRDLRQYNYAVAANVLGNIREVNASDLKKDTSGYYQPGDFCGDLGIEKSYEEYLRGKKGVEILIRDARGRIQGKYENGAKDIAPLSGKDLKLSLDIKLQEYAESLMVNKIGAIVAIEPSTGEILALVSSPTYDPSLLVGKNRGKNYKDLADNKYKPLFDRAVMASYPPGSTFKPSQGLILQQEKIVTLGTPYPCSNGFVSGGLRVGCHAHGSPITLKPALQTSCNAYFCWGFKAMIDRKSKYESVANAFEVWKNHLVSLGFGYKLGVDLTGESRGFIPNAKWYDGVYGENHWSANTIISVSIGQGEILATPLQIANLCATIANRGWYITPHVVKEIKDSVLPQSLIEKHYPTIDKKYFNSIVEGMRMAVTNGTCKKANLKSIEVCGKTGTAQNPRGRDHSAFIGFAPYNNPQIAVCVYVENAGFGAAYGVPIGSLVIEKYLTGKISDERKSLEMQMLKSNTIINSGVKKH